MLLSTVRISNYRSLKDVRIDLSRFVCLAGQNNTGKSAFLGALEFFLKGSRLSTDDHYDPKNDVRVEVCLEQITDADLDLLVPEHRQRIEERIDSRRLTLVRVFRAGVDTRSRLYVRTLRPRDPRFHPDAIADLLARQRPGPALLKKVVDTFPELDGIAIERDNQGVARERIETLAASLPGDVKELVDEPLPTGMDRSLEPMLPEPLLIPAVRNLTDDMRTSERGDFGRLLRIITPAVAPELEEASSVFDSLRAKLNRQNRDGKIVDERIEVVRNIESCIEEYVAETFPGIKTELEIPPPEVGTILTGAHLIVDDGTRGEVDSKGDGLRRAVAFAILRSFADLVRSSGGTGIPAAGKGFVLLFEEPELYLYPRAQHILLRALEEFAARHQVVISTHSPSFLTPEVTATLTFVKLSKSPATEDAPKPFTLAKAVDLGDVSAKDQFQLICYENNVSALFSETVVLVEGDSDCIAVPHLSRTIDPEWDFTSRGYALARINGKSSIRRYKQFFGHFGVRVIVISDLDLIVRDFDQIAVDSETKSLREDVINAADAAIEAHGGDVDVPTAKVRDAQRSGELRAMWARVEEARETWSKDNDQFEPLARAIGEFFAWTSGDSRVSVLAGPPTAELKKMKEDLLVRLRSQDVYLWSKGAIEDYYPDGTSGNGKLMKAMDFCTRVTDKDEALALCDSVSCGGSVEAPEFNAVFSSLFADAP